MKKGLKEYILSRQMSSAEEDRLGISHAPAISAEQMLKNWEEASNKQLIKDRENALLWEDDYKKRRVYEEDQYDDIEIWASK